MRVTAWVVCVIAGQIEMPSGGPGVEVVLEIDGDPDSICYAFDIVRRNLLATSWKGSHPKALSVTCGDLEP
jgi:hypothetical protein